MVRIVHRNILYSVDWEICESKSELGRNSKNWRFRKLGLRGGKMEVWGWTWGLLNCFQRRKYSKIYSGLIRHHPGSISTYETHVFKEIRPTWRKDCSQSFNSMPVGWPIDNPSPLSALGGLWVTCSTRPSARPPVRTPELSISSDTQNTSPDTQNIRWVLRLTYDSYNKEPFQKMNWLTTHIIRTLFRNQFDLRPT